MLIPAIAQEIGIGQWRDHLPYQKVIAVTKGEGKVYAATPFSLFYYNEADNSLNRLNKINGLSDVGVSSIQFHKGLRTLIVAYSNGNIDLVKDEVVFNMSDIKRKTILGNKSINRVVLIGDDAYLACGFGLVVLDLSRREFRGTYFIGPDGTSININDVDFDPVDSLLYAVADEGIFKANIFTANLANFAEWQREFSAALPSGPFNHVAVHNHKVYINRKGPAYSTDAMFVKINGAWQAFQPENTSTRFSMNVFNDRLVVSNNLAVDAFRPDGTMEFRIYTYNPGSVVPADAIIDENNAIWIADQQSGLTRVDRPNQDAEQFKLDGPDFADVYELDAGGNDVWVVPGGRNTAFGSIYRQAQFAGFVDGKWKTVTSKQDTILNSMRDVLTVAVDPANHKRVYFGTWGYGLLEYNNSQFVENYTDRNSTLEKSVLGGNWIGVGGLAFDASNNLWVANSSSTAALSVKKTNGDWKSFNLGPQASGLDLAGLMIDKQQLKWLRTRDHSLVVFNDNNTPDDTSDDQTRRLTSASGNGSLPGNFILSMAADRDGQVWLGSDEGVAVIYSPSNIFSNQNFDAQKVLINQDGFGQYLLEAEAVTSIAVDGANRKWFGTDRAGVFLMSADGTKEIAHFTEENSPLLSNSILSITITDAGEVFFGTSKGIISYRSESVPPQPTYDNLVIFPNPVRESYNGTIAIRGLVSNTNVKITDIAGNLVFSGLSEGGQAVWNGRNFNGDKVQTGVYLVFVTNTDGSKTTVGKIMFIH